MIRDLVVRCRSYRRFREERAVTGETLRDLVDLARLTASAANKQPLRYVVSCTTTRNDRIFPHLAWAGYLHDWDGPGPGERPTAYVVLLGDTETAQPVQWDDGIAAQTMLLGAVERGLGGCIIASIDKPGLRETLAIPERYEILLVIALGEPAETVVLEDVRPDGNIRYWRDKDRVHHVPKRRLDDVILEFG